MHLRLPGARRAAVGETISLTRPPPAFTIVWIALQLIGWGLLAAALGTGWTVNLRGALVCVVAGTCCHGAVGGLLGARAVGSWRRWSCIAAGVTLVIFGLSSAIPLTTGLLLDVGVAGIGLFVGGLLARVLGACR